MVQASVFFQKQNWDRRVSLEYQFFVALKIQNVNNNNFKIVGYQTNVSISRFFHIYIQL